MPFSYSIEFAGLIIEKIVKKNKASLPKREKSQLFTFTFSSIMHETS